jgi:predicted HTH transcriptional regulator
MRKSVKISLISILGSKPVARPLPRKNDGRTSMLLKVSLVRPSCLERMPPLIYGNHATTDIEAIIRRSEVELAAYELKQGLLTLDDKRTIDTNLVDKVLKTICAIANNGPNQTGKILIGVTDSAEDAARVATLDGVKPRKVGKRSVVGINREAQAMKLSTEEYFGKWKNAIKDSGLSTAVKQSVLSNIDFNAFYGMGVLVVTITPQKELSYFNEELYWREGDSTKKAETPKQIAALAQRF